MENAVTFTPSEAYDGTLVQCVASHPLWNDDVNSSQPLNVFCKNGSTEICADAPRLLVDSPVSIVVAEGDSFRENLTVKANPPVSAWRWRKNGAPFEHTNGGIFARGATLSGRAVKGSDSGTYTLFAVNSVGTANVSIVLTVEYPARVSSKHFEATCQVTHVSSPVIANAGDDVVLECHVDGEPKRKGMVKWLRHEKPIDFSPRGDTRAVLRLNASHENAGEYVCVADNGVGKVSFETNGLRDSRIAP